MPGTAEQASVAKRISLARGLQIRAFFIKSGVSQNNIAVQALGNQVPSGDSDRADIFVKKLRAFGLLRRLQREVVHNIAALVAHLLFR